MTKELNEFLEGLNNLTKKYGYEIGGCGCCGSPHISRGKEWFEKLTWNEDKEVYEISECL